MNDETQALDLYRAPGIVAPLVDVLEARAAIEAYEALKKAIVQDGDIQMYQGRPFLKKRFWRRVATFFGLSLELAAQERGFDEGGHLFYSVSYRAIAPNGRSMEADGYCSTAERGHSDWPEHTVRATAHTRAKNRAISDLVGGGEVSAEEMPEEEPRRPAQQQMRQAPRPPQVIVKPALTWNTLSARARKAGLYETQDEWEALVKEVLGDKKVEQYTEADRAKMDEYISSEMDLEKVPVTGRN